MSQPTLLTCQNCGAGLGALEGGHYRCAHCGHLSLPPRPAFDPAERQAMLASLLSQFEAKRAARSAGAGDYQAGILELRQEGREALASGRRTNGYVSLGIGVLFFVFAAFCIASAVSTDFANDGFHASHGRAAHQAPPPPVDPLPPALFGLFFLALGGGLFYLGLRYLRAGARDRRLREKGLRGSAIVRSYRETKLMVDGNTKYELVLEVLLAGSEPYTVKQSDYVPHPGAVRRGADLPVYVDPARPTDVLIDWFTVGP